MNSSSNHRNLALSPKLNPPKHLSQISTPKYNLFFNELRQFDLNLSLEKAQNRKEPELAQFQLSSFNFMPKTQQLMQYFKIAEQEELYLKSSFIETPELQVQFISLGKEVTALENRFNSLLEERGAVVEELKQILSIGKGSRRELFANILKIRMMTLELCTLEEQARSLIEKPVQLNNLEFDCNSIEFLLEEHVFNRQNAAVVDFLLHNEAGSLSDSNAEMNGVFEFYISNGYLENEIELALLTGANLATEIQKEPDESSNSHSNFTVEFMQECEEMFCKLTGLEIDKYEPKKYVRPDQILEIIKSNEKMVEQYKNWIESIEAKGYFQLIIPLRPGKKHFDLYKPVKIMENPTKTQEQSPKEQTQRYYELTKKNGASGEVTEQRKTESTIEEGKTANKSPQKPKSSLAESMNANSANLKAQLNKEMINNVNRFVNKENPEEPVAKQEEKTEYKQVDGNVAASNLSNGFDDDDTNNQYEKVVNEEDNEATKQLSNSEDEFDCFDDQESDTRQAKQEDIQEGGAITSNDNVFATSETNNLSKQNDFTEPHASLSANNVAPPVERLPEEDKDEDDEFDEFDEESDDKKESPDSETNDESAVHDERQEQEEEENDFNFEDNDELIEKQEAESEDFDDIGLESLDKQKESLGKEIQDVLFDAREDDEEENELDPDVLMENVLGEEVHPEPEEDDSDEKKEQDGYQWAAEHDEILDEFESEEAPSNIEDKGGNEPIVEVASNDDFDGTNDNIDAEVVFPADELVSEEQNASQGTLDSENADQTEQNVLESKNEQSDQRSRNSAACAAEQAPEDLLAASDTREDGAQNNEEVPENIDAWQEPEENLVVDEPPLDAEGSVPQQQSEQRGNDFSNSEGEKPEDNVGDGGSKHSQEEPALQAQKEAEYDFDGFDSEDGDAPRDDEAGSEDNTLANSLRDNLRIGGQAEQQPNAEAQDEAVKQPAQAEQQQTGQQMADNDAAQEKPGNDDSINNLLQEAEDFENDESEKEQSEPVDEQGEESPNQEPSEEANEANLRVELGKDLLDMQGDLAEEDGPQEAGPGQGEQSLKSNLLGGLLGEFE